MTATHRCKICGSRWRQFDGGGWSLVLGTIEDTTYANGGAPGPCCDNEMMGEQIEELPKPFVQPWYRICANCGEQRRNHAPGLLSCLFAPTQFREAL